MINEPLLKLELPGITKLKSGKVREVFDLGDQLLFVATDRISAFDCVMPNGIPRKGEVLTQISYFWFAQTAGIVENHLTGNPELLTRTETLTATGKVVKETQRVAFPPWPAALREYRDLLGRRSMVVKKTQPLAIECVVRGYLSGSGWKDYQKTGCVCGIKLPAGLRDSSRLPEPVFTPATKAETGHDENISFEQACGIVGQDIAEKARDLSLKIYSFAAEYALKRGLIIADTKFEFGLRDGKLILIDEVLTPDSSRFWPADKYEAGRGQPSFDKQFVRDYLETLSWNKQPPAPALPPDVIAKTTEKYLDAYQRLTGRSL